MDDGLGYLFGLFFLGGLFFLSAVLALRWAARHGQLREFEKGARSIFDEEEPEGEISDTFPARRRAGQKKPFVS